MLVALFIGNLAADAVLQKGNSEDYLTFRAASTRKYRDPKTGQPVEMTQWVTVNINHNYQNIAQYLTKGTKVFVEGHFSTRIYQDRSQISQVGITINASRVELCGSPNDNKQPVQQQVQQTQPMQYQQRQIQQQPQLQPMQQSMYSAQQQRTMAPVPAPAQNPYAVPYEETDMMNNAPFL